jgi:hypothetical protein
MVKLAYRPQFRLQWSNSMTEFPSIVTLWSGNISLESPLPGLKACDKVPLERMKCSVSGAVNFVPWAVKATGEK